MHRTTLFKRMLKRVGSVVQLHRAMHPRTEYIPTAFRPADMLLPPPPPMPSTRRRRRYAGGGAHAHPGLMVGNNKPGRGAAAATLPWKAGPRSATGVCALPQRRGVPTYSRTAGAREQPTYATAAAAADGVSPHNTRAPVSLPGFTWHTRSTCTCR